MPEREPTPGDAPGPNPHRPPASVADAFDPPQSPDEIGRFGKYRVLQRLGAGGMGEVFAAEHAHLPGRQYALKFMLPRFLTDPDDRRRFLAEAQAVARVKHAHVVAIHDVDELRGVPFIAMERLRGRPLDRYLRKHGPPPVDQVLRVAWEAADGLAAIHARGLIHRDIKPANIWLLAPDGKVKLIDFGLAADTLRDTRHTQSGTILGTPEYTAPEQFIDPRAVDARADLFSLGIVVYQLLTGDRPFYNDGNLLATMWAVANTTPPDPFTRNPDTPLALNALVMRMLAKDRGKRPDSAKGVADELRAINRALGQPAPPPPVPATPTVVARPAPLVAPFGEAHAREGQAAWARFLGRPVVEVIELSDGVKLDLVLIPPGTFTMGSPPAEATQFSDEKQHSVTITRPFYLGKYAITQQQYRVVTGMSPSHFEGERKPVERISHEDAEAFCRKITFRGGWAMLPSDAQWEYACRAGTTTPFHFGAVLNGDGANCNGNVPYGTTAVGAYLKQTCDVGLYPPNAWGLYDMHGNVWEWCCDHHGPCSAVSNPEKGQRKKQSEDWRVLRGGCWNTNAWLCRAAYRSRGVPGHRRHHYGFRVAVRLD